MVNIVSVAVEYESELAPNVLAIINLNDVVVIDGFDIYYLAFRLFKKKIDSGETNVIQIGFYEEYADIDNFADKKLYSFEINDLPPAYLLNFVVSAGLNNESPEIFKAIKDILNEINEQKCWTQMVELYRKIK